MPHSSRKRKSPPAKRIHVLDNDGWTHITNSKTTTARPRPPKPEDQLTPAECPDGLTFAKLREKYEWHRQRWIESQAWTAVKKVLEQELARFPGTIYNCVAVGLGSPSGLLRGGWVDRRSISMFQLAALESILGLLSQTKTINAENLYAQDPVFNDMDKKLLQSIGFKVVQDPQAFSMVEEGTFLYAPGAERVHLMKLLPHNPVLFFGSCLDGMHSVSMEEDAFQDFIERKSSLLLPEFESNPTAFWKATLYWHASEQKGGF
ncbi:hypothetical protein PRK78_001397 [Emydomyces testavorans]|uniref:SRR1-like domain-containing protein n=1 Tax=Emydomyces testavorans TaxID=2070801 RepID=A0AAF0IGM9_9EURO|nr:hypothetical protein PRK78_001397 [Emydomyces testavorans]